MAGTLRSSIRNLVTSVAVLVATVVFVCAADANVCLDDGATYPTTTAPSGDAPFTVRTCDINGDGYADLVTANDASDTVSVLLNLGDGTFSAAERWPVGEMPNETIEPVDVDCCDLDGDGRVDLVTANHTSDDVSVLLNDGNVDGVPQFSAPVRYAVGEAPWAVRCLPVDTDGHDDLVVANFSSDCVSVLLNAGDGTFDPADGYDVPVGDGPRSIAVCDVDGDLDTDVITGNLASKDISVLRNDGDTGLVKIGDFSIGVNPFDVACCELDGINGADVVTANIFDSSVAVLLNEGAGSYGSATRFGDAAGATAIACGRIDGDNKNDIVTANLTSDDLAIFLNAGDGTLLNPTFHAVGASPSSVVAEPLTGTPPADLAAAHGDGVMVFVNDCPVSGDSDGDGDVDLVDLSAFQACIGMDPSYEGCESLDLDGNGLIDLDDFAMLLESPMGPRQ